MLKAGGNAVDAAVAAAFTEGVVEPLHNGVAGYGGCMVIYLAQRASVIAIDCNSVAPAAASEGMFAIAKAPPPAGYRVPGSRNIFGSLAVGVPGVVAGLCLALGRFGSMPLYEVLRPAIAAARYGFVPTAKNRRGLSEQAERMRREFPETARVFLKNGRPPRKGERLTNPDLARTLESLAEGRPDLFYKGAVAGAITACIEESGGCLTLDDMRRYRARVVPPYSAPYRDCRLYTPPLPAGGITTLQMARLLERFEPAEMSVSERLHHSAEAMKACWPERLKRFGDPAFVDIDAAAELSAEFTARLARRMKSGLKSPRPGRLVAPEPISCTSHISTADVAGNLVSLTQTHGGAFGSMLTVPGTGLLLGHGVSRFDPRPGLANSIGPGKAPLHNMAPFIALRDGRPWAAYGLPGGRTIPNNQLTLTLNLVDLGATPQQALDAPRLHTEGAEPLQVERRAGKATLDRLRHMGHQLEASTGIGGPGHIVALAEDPAVQSGATDSRFDGLVTAS